MIARRGALTSGVALAAACAHAQQADRVRREQLGATGDGARITSYVRK